MVVRPGRGRDFVFGLLWGLASPGAQETQFFRIGAAATSGTFFEIGGVIASAISKPAATPLRIRRQLRCPRPCSRSRQATEGSVGKPPDDRRRPDESGIAQSDIAGWAYAGNGIFAADGPMTDLRAIANLFPGKTCRSWLAATARSGLSPICRQTYLVGPKGSGTLADARVILAAAGLTEKDMSAEYLRPGVAAANMGRAHSTGSSLSAAFRCRRSVSSRRALRYGWSRSMTTVLAKIKESSSFYRRSVIPAATYPGIDEDIPSIGFNALGSCPPISPTI